MFIFFRRTTPVAQERAPTGSIPGPRGAHACPPAISPGLLLPATDLIEMPEQVCGILVDPCSPGAL